MPYTSEKPPLTDTADELRARIPGWGVDLDPKDRPSVPKERFDPSATGAHWDFPERQPEKWPRERSIEHKFLTPVFGTSCPPKGLSGGMRKLAYRRYSEGRAGTGRRPARGRRRSAPGQPACNSVDAAAAGRAWARTRVAGQRPRPPRHSALRSGARRSAACAARRIGGRRSWRAVPVRRARPGRSRGTRSHPQAADVVVEKPQYGVTGDAESMAR